MRAVAGLTALVAVGVWLAVPTAPEAVGDTALPSFESSVSSPAGDQPASLTSADLDDDGWVDLVVVDADGTLMVLPGNGSGFFPTRFSYDVGGTPSSVLAAPLRTGGPQDLVVTTSDSVVTLLNNGNGTFIAGQTKPVGASPSSVASGDVDGNGTTDLLTSNAGNDNVSVLLGDGAGGFTSATTVPVGNSPSGLDVGDFDGDRDLDVAVSNADSNTVSVLLGNGDGTFAGSASTYGTGGSTPSSVLVTDLDDDAVPDLVVTDSGTDDVAFLPGAGDGTFGSAVNVTASTPTGPGQRPVAAAATDLDGDGHTDVAVLNAGSQTIGLLLGDGAGGLNPTATLGSGSVPTWLVATDLDGDQRPDLAVSSSGSDSAVTRLNSTPFPLSRPVPGSGPQVPRSRACGDHARLVGAVHATAYRSSWWFSYRQRGQRWHHTARHLVPPDDDVLAVTARVRHLRPGRTLHQRLVVRSNGQTVRGPLHALLVARHCPCRR
jgi:hypothetical protein